MSKDKIAIRFDNLYHLWQFAQAIRARSMEIRTKELLLICDCHEEDLQLVTKFRGTIMETVTVDS